MLPEGHVVLAARGPEALLLRAGAAHQGPAPVMRVEVQELRVRLVVDEGPMAHEVCPGNLVLRPASQPRPGSDGAWGARGKVHVFHVRPEDVLVDAVAGEPEEAVAVRVHHHALVGGVAGVDGVVVVVVLQGLQDLHLAVVVVQGRRDPCDGVADGEVHAETQRVALPAAEDAEPTEAAHVPRGVVDVHRRRRRRPVGVELLHAALLRAFRAHRDLHRPWLPLRHRRCAERQGVEAGHGGHGVRLRPRLPVGQPVLLRVEVKLEDARGYAHGVVPQPVDAVALVGELAIVVLVEEGEGLIGGAK
mmetsp:Transcript_35824/g.111479  ORF Transcript_35824/g.111479 Transcript_35824/m.111479 type:complete len:304 (+) Transcript_35824:178-1089(+)